MAPIEQHPIVIRNRHPNDLPAVTDLALESMAWHADTFGDMRPAPDRQSLLDELRKLENSSDSYFRVADLGTIVSGFLTASITPPPAGGIEAIDAASVYISDIVVSKVARRRGIAGALLVDLEQWAAMSGCHIIRLNMHAGNTAAQQLYEQLGYQAKWITYRKNTPRIVDGSAAT